MNNVIVLMLGDPSDDGHGKKETITIRTNLTKSEMNEAYDKGAEIIGVNLCNDIAANYEDSKVTKEQYDAFAKLDYQFFMDKWQQEELKNGESFSVTKEEYVQMYFFTVKTGDPNFQYQEVLGEDIDIGGYGLFY